jgi:hypothetical protein
MLKASMFAALAALAASAAWADTGPKPTIAIAFMPDKPGVAIAHGELLECADKRCAAPHELQKLGPQRFGCQPLACSGLAYGFSDWQVLQLTLTDGRAGRSFPFARGGFDSHYTARIVGGFLKVAP